MSLQAEIDTQRSLIRTDSYPMSVGELLNLYKDGEIDVHPEFQRIYRWTDGQKTKLIESILLGIPLPPIFVAQRSDGVWDVVDGVQRLSTILQFTGVLKNEDGETVPPFSLLRTKYLPSLEGATWAGADKAKRFTKDQQLYLKRAKIDMNIVLKESSDSAKYELFMRLNTGGTALSAQEVRNCVMVMAHRKLYEWLRGLAETRSFKGAIGLSDRLVDEQYHMELATRFVLFRSMAERDLSAVSDIGEFLNTQLAVLDRIREQQRVIEEEAFNQTFSFIYDMMGDEAFRRYDTGRQKFMGGFSISAFESVALGVGFHFTQRGGLAAIPDLRNRVISLWAEDVFIENSGSGVRASSRIPKIVPLGRRLFTP